MDDFPAVKARDGMLHPLLNLTPIVYLLDSFISWVGIKDSRSKLTGYSKESIRHPYAVTHVQATGKSKFKPNFP